MRLEVRAVPVESGRLRYAIVLALAAGLPACASEGEIKQQAAAPRPALEDVARQAAEAYAAGRWDESEKLYRDMAARVPNEIEPWFRLGNVFGRTNRPDLAVAAYREAVVRNPSFSKAWHNMGVIQLRQAANSFKEMQLHVDPGDPLYEKGETTLDGINALLRGRESRD